VKAWQEHSPKSLRQFVDPPPGRPRAPEEEFEGDPPNQEEGPVETFCLVTLDPKEVGLPLFQDVSAGVFSPSFPLMFSLNLWTF
jgi:hypothetical protein